MVRRKRQDEAPERIYLVRSYDQALVPDDSSGYYFTREEAEEVKQELEERYPEHLSSVEEFDRYPAPNRRITRIERRRDETAKKKR